MGVRDINTSVHQGTLASGPVPPESSLQSSGMQLHQGNCIKIPDFRSGPVGSRVVPIFYREHASQAVERIREATPIANSASAYHGLHELQFRGVFGAEEIEVASLICLQNMIDIEAWITSQLCRWRQFQVV